MKVGNLCWGLPDDNPANKERARIANQLIIIKNSATCKLGLHDSSFSFRNVFGSVVHVVFLKNQKSYFRTIKTQTFSKQFHITNGTSTN